MRKTLAAVLLAATAVAAHAQTATMFTGFIDGNRYRTFPIQTQAVYIAGVVDGFFASGLFDAHQNQVQSLVKCISDMRATNNQLVAIVNRQMDLHPESWGKAMPWLVYGGLIRACQDNRTPIEEQ